MLLLYFALLIILSVQPSVSTDKCESCSRIVDAFRQGLDRTARANFGGGNTQWEESRLGSYAFSETRLVDIVDRLCKDESKEDALICHSLLEGFEETIESWWAKEFKSNQTQAVDEFRQHLCVQHASLCCPYNTFGPNCAPCPTAAKPVDGFCSGHGECDGNGTKSGSGNCTCDEGYSGIACSQCSSGYYSNSTKQVSCSKCHSACSECFGPNSSSCSACASGYAMQHTAAGSSQCQDVNECDTQCKADHEVCTNTEGSFICECAEGYHRVDGKCEKKDQDEKNVDADKEDGEGPKEDEEGLKEEGEEQKEEGELNGSEQAASENKDEL